MVIVVSSSVMSSTVVLVVVMAFAAGDRQLEIVPRHVSEDAILYVSTQKTLFGEGMRVLSRINSPSTQY